jgi:hypothetical protein
VRWVMASARGLPLAARMGANMKTTTEMMQREAIFQAQRNRFSARWTPAGALAPRRPSPLELDDHVGPEVEHHINPPDPTPKP